MSNGQDANFSNIRLTFRALPCPADRHGDSAKRRIRALLKLALRSLSLRCVRIEEDNGECDQIGHDQECKPMVGAAGCHQIGDTTECQQIVDSEQGGQADE
jgi:hypothetical protein